MNTAFEKSLLGGALGDACGHDIEFWSIADIRQHYGEAGVQTLTTPHITDDTQMTLFTAEGILLWHTQSLSTDAALIQCIYEAYLRWLHTQEGTALPAKVKNAGFLLSYEELHVQRAPGATCLSALQTALHTGKPGSREHRLNDSKGCGGIMRVAPVGLYFFRDPEKAFRLAADAAALTHSHPSGFLSSGFFAALLALIYAEASDGSHKADGAHQRLSQHIEVLFPLLKSYGDHEEVLIALDQMLEIHHSSQALTPELLEKMGKNWPGAVGEEALAMGLLCALRHRNFKTGVLASANHSGDSDSTATLTGQVLGMYGDLPTDWVTYISEAPESGALAGSGTLVQDVAAKLYRCAHGL